MANFPIAFQTQMCYNVCVTIDHAYFIRQCRWRELFMKRRPGYLLQRILDTYYLLPYGQLIADHKRGISLNDSGIYVWNLLEKEMSREELKNEYLNQFLSEPDQREALTNDLNQFLNQLVAFQFIEDDVQAASHVDGPCSYLSIAGLVLAVYGPEELIAASGLIAFCVDPQPRADQKISVICGASDLPDGGTALVINPDLKVYERDSDYLLFFPTFSQIDRVSLSKDGSNAFFYCSPNFSEDFGTEFFHAMRHIFLYLAARRGMYAIHSASIRYQGKAWLFSASSGTGKSTHTNLWKKLYGTPVINGDLNLLAIDNGHPVIHGIPWCGTSEIFNKETIPLGGIVLLKQAPEDTLTELSPDKKALLILQRFISPMWAAVQLSDGVRFAEELSQKISVCRLQCTKNDSAAELIKGWIDKQNQMV